MDTLSRVAKAHLLLRWSCLRGPAGTRHRADRRSHTCQFPLEDLSGPPSCPTRGDVGGGVMECSEGSCSRGRSPGTRRSWTRSAPE